MNSFTTFKNKQTEHHVELTREFLDTRAVFF